ncbi:MAG: hypothetical protein MAG431_00873 [Chloroflexi bacterium]|nr:hypothetical protein [Chloroflexota bacterium]
MSVSELSNAKGVSLKTFEVYSTGVVNTYKYFKPIMLLKIIEEKVYYALFTRTENCPHGCP